MLSGETAGPGAGGSTAVDGGGQPAPDGGEGRRIAPIKLSGVRRPDPVKPVADPNDAAAAGRAANGQFQPADVAGNRQPGESIPMPGEEGENQLDPAAPPAPAAKIKFGGQEFDTLEAAEAEFQRIRRQAATARSSQGAADKRLAAIEAQLAASQRQSQPPPSAQSGDDLGIDQEEVGFWQEVRQARRQIAQMADPDQKADAQATLDWHMDKRRSDRQAQALEALIGSKFGGLQAAQELLEVSQQADSMFAEVGALRLDESDPNSPKAFPELESDMPVLARQWKIIRDAALADPRAFVNSPTMVKLLAYGLRGSRAKLSPPAGAIPALAAPPAPPAARAPGTVVGAGFPSTSTPRGVPRAQAPGMLPGQLLSGVLPRR